MDKNKKHGDLFVLSADLQKKRNILFGIKPGEKAMHDLTPLIGKIVTFDKYDSFNGPKKHQEWMCRVSGQVFNGENASPNTGIFEFLIPESSLIPLEEHLKKLIKKAKFKGLYKEIKKDPNLDVLLFAFEIAQQAASAGSRPGIENCVGKEVTDFCAQIYPNIKLADKYSIDFVFGIWKNKAEEIINLDSIRRQNWQRR